MIMKIAKKAVFISSYPSGTYGIATFTADLIAHIKLASEGEFDTIICAMDWGDNPVYSESIKPKIRKDVKYDYIHPAKQSQLRNELN